MRLIADVLNIFLKDSQKFNKIKTENKQSIYFGTAAIIYPLLGLIFGGGAVFFSLKILEEIGNSGNVLLAVLLIIGGAALGIGGALGYLLSLIRGFILASYQLRLERKSLGFVALTLNIIIFAASLILIFLIIKNSP